MYEENCFITLTYAPEHLPNDLSLHKAHYQKFMKRLRFHIQPKTVRYYMCGEYGSENERPHYHACLFNYDFPDKQLWKDARGVKLYISDELTKLWPYGFSTIGDVTFESAAYVARYIMKKVTGKQALEVDETTGLRPYELFDTLTGEVHERQPEYTAMSLKPGIGAKWYEKYKNDVYPSDNVVVNGTRMRPPKYYDTLLERELSDPDQVHTYGQHIQQQLDTYYRDLKESRKEAALRHADNNTPRRLKDRETFKAQQVSHLIRNL